MAFPVVTGTATLPIGVAQLPNYTSDAGALSAPINTEIVKKSFASTVAYLLPQGDSTLFTLTDRMMTEEAAQIEHGFFAKIMVFPTFTVSAAATNVATTLTAYDGSNVIPNGLYMIVGTTTGGAGALTPQVLYSSEVVLVTAVAGNTLTVTRGVGTTAATIPIDSTLVNIGNAFPDASTRPNSFLTKEIRVVNYTQIFRNAWVLSGTMAAIQNVIGDQNPAKGKYECSQYHAMDIEKSLIHGRRSLNMGVAGTSNAFRTMGGIIAQITDAQSTQLFLPNAAQASNITTANSRVSGTPTAGALSLTDLEAFLDVTTNMSYNPQSAGERYMFVGRVAHVVINQLLRVNTQYQVENGVTEWGLRFKKMLFTRVCVYLIEHPLFNTNLNWAGLGLVVDVSSLSLAYLKGRKTKPEFFNQQGTAIDNGIDAVGGSLLTEMTMMCKNPSGCGVITNIRQAVGPTGALVS